MPNRARNLARKIVTKISPDSPSTDARPSGNRQGQGGRPGVKKGPQSPPPAAPAAPPASILVDALCAGEPLDAAVMRQIRTWLAARNTANALALATSLSDQADTRDVGLLAQAVVAWHRGYPQLAQHAFEEVPEGLWTRFAVDEFVRTGLQVAPEATLTTIRELLDRSPSPLSGAGWLEMTGPLFAYKHHDLARDAFAHLDAAVNAAGPDAEKSGDELTINRDWLRPWVAGNGDSPSTSAPADTVSFAVVDYGHPGRNRASANIGDHVQSLASLGHLARQQGLSYEGEADLVELLEQLSARVRPEMAVTDVDARINLVAVDRDASMFKEVPPNTWTLGFGWFMHPMFGIRYGFPFHDNLLPILVSFHCNHRGLLSPEAIEYLRRFGPVGCRDWTTVDIMLSVGVPAFFSGCLTTTVGTVFPDLVERPDSSAPVAYVDVPAADVPSGAPTYFHSDDAVRFRSFATNVYDAIELLETYRRKHSGLVTSRLHCYLPGRAIGVPVDFQPRNRSDIRFAGLIDINESQFNAIRDGINQKLNQVLGAAFAGGSPDEVFALWRELTAEDVAAAERRHTAPARMAPARADLSAHTAKVVAATVGPESIDGETNVAVVVPRGQADSTRLKVLLTSIAQHATGPVHVWLVGRAEASELTAAGAHVPGIAVSAVSTRGLGGSLRKVNGTKMSPADLDVLALGELLPTVDKVVVLPIDALVTDDIATLAALDLEGHQLAAPNSESTLASSGFQVLHRAGNRLKAETVAAAELRRQGHDRHAFDFDAFDVNVLLLDLAQWREDGMLSWSIPYIEQFGLTMQELLFLKFGPERAVVPARWHAIPGCTLIDDAALLHWSEPNKPWSPQVAPAQDLWLEAAGNLV